MLESLQCVLICKHTSLIWNLFGFSYTLCFICFYMQGESYSTILNIVFLFMQKISIHAFHQTSLKETGITSLALELH